MRIRGAGDPGAPSRGPRAGRGRWECQRGLLAGFGRGRRRGVACAFCPATAPALRVHAAHLRPRTSAPWLPAERDAHAVGPSVRSRGRSGGLSGDTSRPSLEPRLQIRSQDRTGEAAQAVWPGLCGRRAAAAGRCPGAGVRARWAGAAHCLHGRVCWTDAASYPVAGLAHRPTGT